MSQLTNMILNAAIQKEMQDAAAQRKKQSSRRVVQAYDQLSNAGNYPAGFIGPRESPEAIRGKRMGALTTLHGEGENLPLSVFDQQDDLDVEKTLASFSELEQYREAVSAMSTKNAQDFLRRGVDETRRSRAQQAERLAARQAASKMSGISVQKLEGLEYFKEHLSADAYKSTFRQYVGFNAPSVKPLMVEIGSGRYRDFDSMPVEKKTMFITAANESGVDPKTAIELYWGTPAPQKTFDQAKAAIWADGFRLSGFQEVFIQNVSAWASGNKDFRDEPANKLFVDWADANLNPSGAEGLDAGTVNDQVAMERAVKMVGQVRDLATRLGPLYPESLLLDAVAKSPTEVKWQAIARSLEGTDITLDEFIEKYAEIKGLNSNAVRVIINPMSMPSNYEGRR